MHEFLQKHGWKIIAPIEGDASLRRYFRTEKNGRSGLLMDCSAEKPGTLEHYVQIAEYLGDLSLSVPEIYELDMGRSLALIEDFGRISFKDALNDGQPEEELYKLAVEVLGVLRESECTLDLPKYYESPVHQGRRRLVDWYAPLMRGRANEPGLEDAYLGVWDAIEAELEPAGEGFVHADYHVENLLLLPDRAGVKRAGVIDFQDALNGPPAYDLVNILEDARRDVNPDLRSFILSHYSEAEQLRVRILGTQFHSRVIGQFIKLALAGKPQYLQYIPRLHGYMRNGLKHPLLAPLKSWLLEQDIDFDKDTPEIDLEALKLLISEGAF